MSKEEATFLQKTKDLFNNRSKSLTLEKIDNETSLNYAWLVKFPESNNPGINYVEELYNYLTKNN